MRSAPRSLLGDRRGRARPRAREKAYAAVDEAKLARSLPGVGAIGGPGAGGRRGSARAHRQGVVVPPLHRVHPQGLEDRPVRAKGQAMSKAGTSWLRDQLVCSANVARTIDPNWAGSTTSR